jgi:hypothetical protein
MSWGKQVDQTCFPFFCHGLWLRLWGFPTAILLLQNQLRGYRCSRGRTRTIHFRHILQRQRWGTWLTHTSTRHNSHHQVLPVGVAI